MKHTCNTCAGKARCLKRSYLIYLLYIVTGRSKELTADVRDNICVEEECKNWLPF